MSAAALSEPATVDSDGAVDALFAPRSVAIVGATDGVDYGGRALTAALRAGDRVRVYPVSRRYEELQGVRCYPSVAALPEAPDLILVAVGAAGVLDVLEESHQKGARAAVVISAGFAERGEAAGLARQQELTAFARRTGMRIVGPNCLGVADVLHDIWTCALNITAPAGNVAVICQSGATAFATLVPRARDLNLGLRCLVSSGNEADLEIADFVDYFARDVETKVIAVFAESLKSPRRFLAAARRAAEYEKPIVLMKIGRSIEGSRAALTHTAALTGDDEVFDALFVQYGVTRVDDYDDLIEISRMFAGGRRAQRRAVTVGSHSGGVCSLVADTLGASGVALPPLSESAQIGLDEIQKGRGWVANPADLSGIGDSERFASALRFLTEEPDSDAVVFASQSSVERMSHVIAQRAQTHKEIFHLWTDSRSSPDLAPVLASDVPVFFGVSPLVRGLDAFFSYSQFQQRFAAGLVARTDLPARQAMPEWVHELGYSALCEHDSLRLVDEWAIRTPRRELVDSPDAAVGAAEQIGLPVVLKADGPGLLHKTDIGAVKLGISTAAEVRTAYDEVTDAARTGRSDDPMHGVLVCETIAGATEVIVGVRRDPSIGPILVFGLGGTSVEIYRDVVRRLCPITPTEARDMVTAVRGAPLLMGARGRRRADVDALVDLLVAVSERAAALDDQLVELDLNPVMVLPEGEGLVVVDALAVIGAQPAGRR